MVGDVEMCSLVQPLVFGLSLIFGEMKPLDCKCLVLFFGGENVRRGWAKTVPPAMF